MVPRHVSLSEDQDRRECRTSVSVRHRASAKRPNGSPFSCKRWLAGNKVPDILARRVIRAPQEARSWHRSLLRNAWDQLAAALRACGGTPVLLPHGRSVVDGGEEPSLHTVFEDVEHPVDLCVFQQDFSFSTDPRCAAV